MNYYPHHIGDFNSATRHLTRMERSVYRDLIDLYYDTELPLTLDFNALCRLIIARSDEERTAVQQVLNEFFTETEHGWFHERCDDEILKYHANREAKSAAGKASAARRAQKSGKKPNTRGAPVDGALNESATPVEQVLNECATNQEPRTNNQEEKEKTSKKSAAAQPASLGIAQLADHGVEEQTAREFLAIRRRKRAPLTEIALRGIRREADRVGWSLDQALKKCIERGWQGFEAQWVERDLNVVTGATRHGNFNLQDYHAGVASDGSF